MTIPRIIKPFVSAYKRFISSRRTAYCKIFKGPYGHEVLQDLAKFCHAHDSAFHTDARAHAVLEGRREVWIRIMRHLQLNDGELWELYETSSQHVKKILEE